MMMKMVAAVGKYGFEDTRTLRILKAAATHWGQWQVTRGRVAAHTGRRGGPTYSISITFSGNFFCPFGAFNDSGIKPKSNPRAKESVAVDRRRKIRGKTVSRTNVVPLGREDSFQILGPSAVSNYIACSQTKIISKRTNFFATFALELTLVQPN